MQGEKKMKIIFNSFSQDNGNYFLSSSQYFLSGCFSLCVDIVYVYLYL